MTEERPVQAGGGAELLIERLGSGGEGVARIKGFTVFVPGALPGERVRARIALVKKNYAAGVLEDVSEASPARAAPRCPVYGTCGGCQLQHMAYEAQLVEKRRQVEDALRRIGGLTDVSVASVLGMDDPWGYRNKMQFPVGLADGAPAIGCFARGSHTIVGTERCFIQKQANNDIMNAMRGIVRRLAIPVYDEDRHTGVLRHIMGRVGADGDAMAVLVTADKELRRVKDIVRLLRERVPRLVSVQQNVQSYHTNVILGRETRLLWGRADIRDAIGDLSFHISPRSFFQVNTAQAEALYRTALGFAELRGRETVVDAYCGTGTITLFLARAARRVYGIEVVPSAVFDARKNARDNRIRNAEFLVGDAARLMPRLYQKGVRPDVIVTDPPRAGCTPIVLETFARMKPKRIVYVSCNPATLARDLAHLQTLGYRTEKVQPVDMFPMTSHVETVALLSRRSLN